MPTQTHPLIMTWRSMIQRCHNPNARSYGRYGARGIAVCDRWRSSFDVFVADVIREIGTRPSANHSIDRFPNQLGNYEPGNIRWATSKEQANNRRNNTLITAFGKTQTLKMWADERGVDYATLRSRISRNGWDVEKALTVPVGTAEARAAAPSRGRLRFSDMVGMTIERLTIVRHLPGKKGKNPPPQFVCLCSCGNPEQVSVPASSLSSRLVRSCGCLVSERMVAMNKARAEPKKIITVNGESLPIDAWAARLGVTVQTINYRLKTGMSEEAAVTTRPDARGSWKRKSGDGDDSA